MSPSDAPPEDLRLIRESGSSLTIGDVKAILAIVGRAGTIQALAVSDVHKAQVLADLARANNVNITSTDAKRKIAAKLVHHVDRRITKTLQALKTMSREDIVEYLKSGVWAGRPKRRVRNICFLGVQSAMPTRFSSS